MYNFDLKRFCELRYGETLDRIIDAIVNKEKELDGIERTQAKQKKSAIFYPYKAKGDKEALGRLAYVVRFGTPPTDISDDEFEMFREVKRRMKVPAPPPKP